MWKYIAPMKASATVWRLIWDRFPTRANLRRKQIIHSEEEALWSASSVETASHLFLDSDLMDKIWKEILKWMKVEKASHN